MTRGQNTGDFGGHPEYNRNRTASRHPVLSTPVHLPSSDPSRTIGILGGMGPQAGFDLATAVTAETVASTDQDHLPVVVWSNPAIPDRTAWLADHSAVDPAPAIAEGFIRLERAGAGVAGMACNTAHTPAIFDRVQDHLRHAGAGIRVLHLIRETVNGIRKEHPDAARIGILGTRGTLTARMYHDALHQAGFDTVSPDDPDRLTSAIYDPTSGIKACSSPVSAEARDDILAAIRELKQAGAEAIILGCTELPLAVPERDAHGIPLINPARMLARALIASVDPSRVRP